MRVSLSSLSISGVGIYLPPTQSVVERASKFGANTQDYQGYQYVSIAKDEDHPSSMAVTALRKAMENAKVSSSQIKLLISCGISRDYLPSWSLATEVMQLLSFPPGCFGFDITIGCLGTLTGLELAHSWLQNQGGGYAAIINAERWNYTVDYKTAPDVFWGRSQRGICDFAVVALGWR